MLAALLIPAANWLVDPPQVERILETLGEVAPHWIYIVVGAGAAIENVFPPIPADTFVVLGAFLSAQGRATGLGVFGVTWATNTATALLIYALARRWGRIFLGTRAGRWLLRPRQLERLERLYSGHGAKIIFFSRFLPAFRVLVPVFAGISHLTFWRTAFPVAVASALWYGVLVYVGVVFGRNWRSIIEALGNVNTILIAIAGLLAVALTILWWRTRRHAHETGIGGGGER